MVKDLKLKTAPAVDIQKMGLLLVGDSPLIVHAWSQKAKDAILRKQQKKAPTGKEIRDPDADFQASLYRLADGAYGFPAVAFKSAAVTVCSQLHGISKVFARQAFHVCGGDLVRLHGPEPVMREDMVRVGMGSTDLRYRGEFRDWWTEITIEHNASAISSEQLVAIFNAAGFGVGVGDWRPERDGRNGRFHVATGAEAETLIGEP